MRSLAVLLIALVVAACDAGPLESPLASTQWGLILFAGEDPSFPAALRFDDAGRVYGSTPCNSFEGTYVAFSGGSAGNRFGIDIDAWTEISCTPELATYESQLDAALRRVSTWSVDRTELRLTHPEVSLTFRQL